GAEHVLSFRDPGNGCDVDRMQPEQARHKKATPNASGHSTQQKKKQERVGTMEQQIRQMVAPWLERKNLAVEHVRTPAPWMPVGRLGMTKSPAHTCPGQPLLH